MVLNEKKKQGLFRELEKANLLLNVLILMFVFHEKCQSLGHVKMQNLPCNTPLFLVFLPHSEPLQRLKKENLRFHRK